MGLAIAAVAVPAFLLAGIASLWLAFQFGSFTRAKWGGKRTVLIVLAGFVFAVVLTMVATWAVPQDQRSFGWIRTFSQIAVVILCPLIVGIALLILKVSLRPSSPALAQFAGGVLIATSVTPFAVPLAFLSYQYFETRLAFEALCGTASVEILKPAQDVKSVAFLPDSVTEPAAGRQAETRHWSVPILDGSTLEFVDRPATEWSGLKGTAGFERVRMAEGRNPENVDLQIGGTVYAYEPLDAITAEYVVRSEQLPIEDDLAGRLGGARVTVFERRNNRHVGRIQYFWSNELYRSCPKETESGTFVRHFIELALSLGNPKSLQRAPP
jgi:hypothetical protein